MMSFKAFEVNIIQPCTVLTYNNLGEEFFGLFEESLLKKGKLTIIVKAARKYGNIQLLFSIVGAVVLVCDRSMETFNYPIHMERNVTFKLGKENRELTADLYTIEQKNETINIAQHIYDFVSLEVPMKKLHPRFCNHDLL
jgi:uncharacterized metal-binding protein YceD (DUF177 family)